MKLPPSRMILMAGLALAIVILCVYYFVNPMEEYSPKCVFHATTGWDCPGCGIQRALHALMHGDIISAWKYNAAIFVLFPYVVALIVAEFMRESHRRFYSKVNSRKVALIACALIVVWWISRNIFNI